MMVEAKASSASFCSSTSRIAASTFTSSSDIVSIVDLATCFPPSLPSPSRAVSSSYGADGGG